MSTDLLIKTTSSLAYDRKSLKPACATISNMTSEDDNSGKVCRFCGQERSSGKFIFSFEAAKLGLLSKIKRLFPDEMELVSVESPLPKYICDSCEMTIHDIEAFRQAVKQAQQILLRKLESKKPDVDPNAVQEGKTHHSCPVLQKENAFLVSRNDKGSLICYSCKFRLRYDQVPKDGCCYGVCKDCGYRSEINEFLRKRAKFNCPKCTGENGTRENDLLERKFECEICKKRYVIRSHLNRHRITHFGKKPFTCDDCGASFWQKSTLQTHLLIHKKINPFPCTWCGQNFRHKATLASHVMSIHGVTTSSGKLYECDKCSKKFVHKERLRRHYRSHSGEKPFKCVVCDKHFTQRINLQTHFKKHENESQFRIPNDDKIQDHIIQELLSFESMPTETNSLPTFPTVNEEEQPFRKETKVVKSEDITNSIDFNEASSSYMIYSSNSILYDLVDQTSTSALPSFSKLNSNSTTILPHE